MKKLFKNYIALFSVLALLSACTEEVDYSPAQPSAVAETEYYFNRDQSTSAVLALTDNEYAITIERANTENDVTIDIDVNAVDSVFTIPKAVTFKAGEKTAEIVVTINEKMELFKNYKVELTIPEEYTNPYKEDNYSIFTANFIKEDYVPYAKAEYVWGFIGGLSHEQEIEYSAILNQYRMKAPWADPVAADLYVNYVGYGAEDGEDVCFTITEETGAIVVSPASIKTGVVHPNYGSVTANFEAGVVRDGALLFQYKWTVAAGSFGSMVDQVNIVEVY